MSITVFYIFKFFIFLSFLLCCLLISYASCEKDITINVMPGTEECFFETFKVGQVLDIDYQVIDGGHGALDISFYLLAPSGRLIVLDQKKSDKSHRIETNENGDYKMCFDNRFSSFNIKTVYFELIVEDEGGTDTDYYKKISTNTDKKLHEMTINVIEESVNKVKLHLMKARYLQESIRVFLTRDKNTLDGNIFLINYWSGIQIIIMATVGIIQVIMVKSLFDDQSKVQRFWKSFG